MKIYSTSGGGEYKKEQHRKYGLGMMLQPSKIPTASSPKTGCSLDNGAFGAWQNGCPFNEYAFLKALDACQRHRIQLDFIVVPDVVAGGIKSMRFSKMWMGRLQAPNLAFVVQDGIHPHDILWLLSEITTIFIGGTVEWKWETAKMWIEFAHKNGKKCHIGQCGKRGYLDTAYDLGADSCDSSSWSVNDSWGIVADFKDPKQMRFKL